MRDAYRKELEQLDRLLVELGVLIEDAIDEAISALFQKKENLAEAVLEQELQVSKKEQEIQALCMKLLLRQQPVAGDLRKVSAALKMVTDMARIGDQAGDIAEITLRLPKDLEMEKISHIRAMAKESTDMVKKAVEAYVGRDFDRAVKVIRSDDVVDSLFCEVKQDLVNVIREGAEEEIKVEAAVDMLLIAKYFERIGDHAVNIAGWVAYSITGERYLN